MLQSSSKYLTENHHHLLQFNSLAESFPRDLLNEVDLLRIIARAKQKQKKKETLGQFLTPASVAELMAGMFEKLNSPQISLLDAGAGSGSLLAAVDCTLRVPTLSVSTTLSANLTIIFIFLINSLRNINILNIRFM
jgi:type I restriction-modification system DNA methylase subunit